MLESILGAVAKVLEKIPLVEAWQARKKGHREHDSGKFRELDSILPETALKRLLDTAYQASIPRTAFEPVDHYLDWAEYSSNRFLIKKIRKAADEFTRRLRSLRGFLSVNIFPMRGGGGNPDYLYFRPDQNPDIGGSSQADAEYFRRQFDELNKRMDAAEAAYGRLRAAVKAQLYV
jgi:hypothetical protein